MDDHRRHGRDTMRSMEGIGGDSEGIGLRMLSDGRMWFSLGFAGGHALVVDINEARTMLVVAAPASTRQLELVESFYEDELSWIPDPIILNRSMSPYARRKALLAMDHGNPENPRLILLEDVAGLYANLRTDSRRYAISSAISSLMSDPGYRVIATDVFSGDMSRIGRLSDSSGFVMAIGRMTPLYSQLVFGSVVNNVGVGDSWSAIAMTPDGMTSFGLRNHMVPATKGRACR